MPGSSEAGLAAFQHVGLRAWPPQRRTYPSTVEKVLGPKDDPTFQHFGVEDMSAAKNTWGRTESSSATWFKEVPERAAGRPGTICEAL
jgi:hypothetical protein